MYMTLIKARLGRAETYVNWLWMAEGNTINAEVLGTGMLMSCPFGLDSATVHGRTMKL